MSFLGEKYYTQQQRAGYTARTFAQYLDGRILNVGGGDAGLHQHVEHCTTIDIDVSSRPDAQVNLDRGPLPFPSSSFDCIVCTEVLEHLDQVQMAFRELIRVTRKYVIISLPNCWVSLKSLVTTGDPNTPTKFYGLPLDYPSDRHRWFFGYSEAEAFIRGMAARMDLEVLYLEPHFGKRNQLKSMLLSPFLSKQRVNNLYASFLWTVIAKRQPEADNTTPS